MRLIIQFSIAVAITAVIFFEIGFFCGTKLRMENIELGKCDGKPCIGFSFGG